MNDCPLYYVGETVWYVPHENNTNFSRKCIIIHADYYSREESLHNMYCERYIIKTLEDDGYFTCNFTNNGIEYNNANRCAGEYLRKMTQIEPPKYMNKHTMI